MEQLYTISDIQRILHVGKNTAYKLVKLQGFPAIQIGKKILIPQKSLEKWILDNCGTKINI